MNNRRLAALLLGLVSGVQAAAFDPNAPLLPNGQLTPGDVLTSDTRMICQPGYTKTVRNVPSALKNQIYRQYGVTSRAPGEYEIDHLISLELGGSNSARNLWPESFKTMPLNAHVKDALENKLHDLACSGRISMQEAQQAIAANWEAAYVRYLGPLPGGQTPGRATVPNTAVPSAAVQTIPAAPLAPAVVPGTPGPAAGSTPPSADGSCPDSAPIKISRAGVFHLPQGDGSYSKTHATACFPDARSAAAAGFRGVK